MLKKNLIPALLLTGLSLFALNTQAATELGFDYDGKSYTGNSLPAAIRNQLYELDVQMNQQRQQMVENYIMEAYLRDRAKAEDTTVEKLAATLLEVPKPDAKAIRAFYDENWERIQQPFDEVKDELEAVVWDEHRQNKALELLKTVKADKQFQLTLPVPDAPVFEINTAGYPFKGNKDAAITIVEFADFQCPHCKVASEEAARFMTEHAEQARLVYRHMPINPSGISRKVAAGSVCADQQGKFWEYHDLAFAQQDKLNDKSALGLATELKLDEAAFKTCLEDPKTAEAITASVEEATALGISGTPSFFVNGKPLDLHGDFAQDLTAAIAALTPAAEDKPTETAAETATTEETPAKTAPAATTAEEPADKAIEEESTEKPEKPAE